MAARKKKVTRKVRRRQTTVTKVAVPKDHTAVTLEFPNTTMDKLAALVGTEPVTVAWLCEGLIHTEFERRRGELAKRARASHARRDVIERALALR